MTPNRRSRATRAMVLPAVNPSDVPALSERLRALLEDGACDQVVCDVAGLTNADAGSVHALARLQLTARRLGSEMRLQNASRELQELIHVMGLCEAVPCAGELCLESSRQSEHREEPLGIEEEGDPADPTI